MTDRVQPGNAPPHVWQRIAEEVQQGYPQDLELTAITIEQHFTDSKRLPYPQEIITTIARTARTYGLRV